MATMTMFDASQSANAFYVPQFKLVAHPLDKTDKDGNPMPADVVHDVTEVTYKDKLEEIDSCELVVNNWDEVNRCFKYVGAETLDEGRQARRRRSEREVLEPVRSVPADRRAAPRLRARAS